MEISSHDSYVNRLSAKLSSWLKRRSRRLDPLWLEAALILLRLDLDPIRDELAKLYSASSRGQPPIDPLLMLRSMLLMHLIGFTSIDMFAKRLRCSKRLAKLAGFTPFKTPSVGAFYTFLDRIEDGPFQRCCSHRLRPSSLPRAATAATSRLRNNRSNRAVNRFSKSATR